MNVVVAKVDEILFEGDAESLTVPGSEGELTILPEHMPLITTLNKGTVTVHAAGSPQTFPIESGILEVRTDGATVIL